MKNNALKVFGIVIMMIICAITRAQDNPTQSSGDLYQGLTKKVTYNQMIPPYGIEVSYHKTVHIIFPSPIAYVDLGSDNILAGKADAAENVLRVKSAVEGFVHETNFAVITADGSFHTFNVKYAKEPEKLSVEIKDFQHQTEGYTTDKKPDVYLQELGNEAPATVQQIMKSIYEDDKQLLNHIGSKKNGMAFGLKSIYVQNDMLYFHTQIKNSSNLNFEIDFIRFKIVDKKVSKRTAIQERIVYPLRAHNNLTTIEGNSTLRTLFALQKFTIPDNKVLMVELFEKNGGRHQSFIVENRDIIKAKTTRKLKTK